eukprot:7317428-Lingulodinium_polyedra.AAC.1
MVVAVAAIPVTVTVTIGVTIAVSSVATLAQALFGTYQPRFLPTLAPMKQSSLLAFAVVGKQAGETREARKERQRA